MHRMFATLFVLTLGAGAAGSGSGSGSGPGAGRLTVTRFKLDLAATDLEAGEQAMAQDFRAAQKGEP